jgi:hypothetical protein
MINVDHPLLPFSLEYDEVSGNVVRRRGAIAEAGTPTDAVLAVILYELQQVEAPKEEGAVFDPLELADLKDQINHLRSEITKLKKAQGG